MAAKVSPITPEEVVQILEDKNLISVLHTTVFLSKPAERRLNGSPLVCCRCVSSIPILILILKLKTVSSSVLFLYDWILMLSVELDVVWSEKLRPLNMLYIIQRYMPFVDTIGIISVGKDDVLTS
jgi:hypothetical protein